MRPGFGHCYTLTRTQRERATGVAPWHRNEASWSIPGNGGSVANKAVGIRGRSLKLSERASVRCHPPPAGDRAPTDDVENLLTEGKQQLPGVDRLWPHAAFRLGPKGGVRPARATDLAACNAGGLRPRVH